MRIQLLDDAENLSEEQQQELITAIKEVAPKARVFVDRADCVSVIGTPDEIRKASYVIEGVKNKT